MLDLNYPDPGIPGQAPPGRRIEARSPNPDSVPPMRVRIFDLLTDHPRKLVLGWFALVGLAGSIVNRPEWITWGAVIPAMAMIAIGAAAVVIRLISGPWRRSRRA